MNFGASGQWSRLRPGPALSRRPRNLSVKRASASSPQAGEEDVFSANGVVTRLFRDGLCGKSRDAGPARPYVPTETAVCSVERSSLTPGPMVEETAARSR